MGRNRPLIPLILCPCFDIHTAVMFFPVFVDELSFKGGNIVRHVERSQITAPFPKKRIVSHPVGKQISQPGHPLVSIVINPFDTDPQHIDDF